MKIKPFGLFFHLFLLFSPLYQTAAAGEAISRIQHRGIVSCGAKTFPKAYAWQTADKRWHGIDVDLCRLTAAVVLGDADRIKIVSVTDENGFTKLNNGEIDVLAAATPWTIQTDTLKNAYFPAPFYHSSFGFIGKRDETTDSMEAYKGKKVCVSASSLTLQSLTDYNKKYGLELRVMKMPDLRRAKEFYYLGRCDLLFDRTEILHSDYFEDAPAEVSKTPLPEVVHPYATGIFIKDNDKELGSLLRWSIYALIAAERKGITSQNTEDFENTQDVAIQAVLNDEAAVSQRLGVPSGFMRRAISLVGNYGEIYERNLGSKSHLNLPRDVINRQVPFKAAIWAPDFNE